MASLRVRIGEGETAQPNLLWDSIWSPQVGQADWAIAAVDEVQNRGGLQAKAALHTAIVLSLFTDRRIPDDHPLRYLIGDSADQRGWWGDGVDIRADLFEMEMGSLLWIFERSVLTEEIRQWVEAIALEALAPLIKQGLCVRIDAQASAKFEFNQLDLSIQLYGRDGGRVYDQKFDDIWSQSVTSPKPRPFPMYQNN